MAGLRRANLCPDWGKIHLRVFLAHLPRESKPLLRKNFSAFRRRAKSILETRAVSCPARGAYRESSTTRWARDAIGCGGVRLRLISSRTRAAAAYGESSCGPDIPTLISKPCGANSARRTVAKKGPVPGERRDIGCEKPFARGNARGDPGVTVVDYTCVLFIISHTKAAGRIWRPAFPRALCWQRVGCFLHNFGARLLRRDKGAGCVPRTVIAREAKGDEAIHTFLVVRWICFACARQ